MRFSFAYRALSIAPLLALALLAGCLTKITDIITPGEKAPVESASSENCAKSKSGCLRNNFLEVQKMIADPRNEWVTETDPGVGSSGNRLLAYIGSAPQLTCAQLFHGEVETDNAMTALNKKKSDDQEAANRSLLDVATKANDAIASEQEIRCKNFPKRA